jgi:drug/metabolite transporter (DMT)-like permease
LRRLDTTRSAEASRRVAGLGLAAAAAALWALGGITAQDLFSHHRVDPGWLVGVRMACGGLLLLAAFRPAWPRGHGRLLIAVAVIGIAGAQYTWFAAIAKSNVALATFVQYSAVAMTASWQMLRRQVRPTPRRLAAVAAATAGGPGGLHASRADQAGIALALVSAVLYSFYLLGSARLVRETGGRSATAWGLSIGSLPILVIFPPWAAHPSGRSRGRRRASRVRGRGCHRDRLQPVAGQPPAHHAHRVGGALTILAVLLLAPSGTRA